MRVAICLFSRMHYRRICFEDEINEESCQSTLGSSSVALFIVCVGHHLTFRNECGDVWPGFIGFPVVEVQALLRKASKHLFPPSYSYCRRWSTRQASGIGIISGDPQMREKREIKNRGKPWYVPTCSMDHSFICILR